MPIDLEGPHLEAVGLGPFGSVHQLNLELKWMILTDFALLGSIEPVSACLVKSLHFDTM